MAGPTALGEFLAARRARLRPADVGVTALGNRRRVPGLRRDEVAQLAGVSTSYYSRLEQGSSRSASPAVLAAVARALALNPEEQQHLRRLADAGGGSPRSRPAVTVSPATRELLAALGHVPALVQDRRTDVLAWNELGHAVLASHLDLAAPEEPAGRPNLARLVFSPAGRALYGDWPRRAAAVVAGLRQAAGQDPHDAVLAALVTRLREDDAGFARLWDEHDLRACEATAYELHHPAAGTLVLTQHSLGVARATEQTLLVLVPAPGSATERALLAGRAGAWTGRRIGSANPPPFGPARTAARS